MDYPESIFLSGDDDEVDPRPHRPVSQGDVFDQVTVASATLTKRDEPLMKGKSGKVMVVAPTCGIYRGGTGERLPILQLAPINKLSSLAPGWGPPWTGEYATLPLPGLEIEGEMAAANLARIGLANGAMVTRDNRIACVTMDGARVVKGHILQYYARDKRVLEFVDPPAKEEWHEVDLWEHWAKMNGTEEGFQVWLDEPHDARPAMTRREALYQDLPQVWAALRKECGG